MNKGIALVFGLLAACDAPVTGTPVIVNPPVTYGATLPGGTCPVETHSTLRVDGRLIETFTSNGQLFNFETTGAAWPNNGAMLSTVAHYASGPCASAGAACRFDTRAFVNYGGQVLEYITAYGKNWTFNNGVATDVGSDLATNPRYAEACGGRQPCTFDTRTFVVQDNVYIESITAYGRIFELTFGSAGTGGEYPTARNGQDLTSVSYYAAGPCAGRVPGTCTLDGRTYIELNGQVVEVVTAYGKVWRFNSAGTPVDVNGQLGLAMNTLSPWNRGICR
jgi:hypothetical protein